MGAIEAAARLGGAAWNPAAEAALKHNKVDVGAKRPGRRAGSAKGPKTGGPAAMVCNLRGVVTRSSDPAAAMFRCSPSDLEGVPVRILLSETTSWGTPASPFNRYWSGLRDEGIWHRFQATDYTGKRFPVEAAITRVAVDSEPLLLLQLRLCDQ